MISFNHDGGLLSLGSEGNNCLFDVVQFLFVVNAALSSEFGAEEVQDGLLGHIALSGPLTGLVALELVGLLLQHFGRHLSEEGRAVPHDTVEDELPG